MKQNVCFVLLVWIFGTTIIGNLFVYLVIAYKGLSVGYTISAIIACLGVKCGSIFVFSSLLLQNIFFLPSVFVLADSGIKFYKRIIKNNVNIKSELIRHFVILLISLLFSLVSAIIEAYISINILIFLKNFI